MNAAPGSSRAQRALTIACVSLVVLAIVVQALLPSPRKLESGSATSSEKDGRRALRLVLAELGFAPETWAHPPGALPRGAHVLWLAEVPVWPDVDEAPEQGADDDSDREKKRSSRRGGVVERSRQGLHAPEHYLRFVESGGTLVVPWTVRVREFLGDALDLGGIGAFAVADGGILVERGVRIASDAELRVRWPDHAVLPAELCDTLARPLWHGADEGRTNDVLAATIPVGEGRVVVLASDAFTRNGELGAAQDGELAVRLLEELGAVERVFFDEYALGDWEPESALALAFSPGIAPVTWHLLALLAVFVWLHAWVRAFPRDPEGLEQLSPLSRAQAQANVLERARRHSVLAGFARRAALARMQRAAGLVRGPGDTTSAAAVEQELAHVAERLGAQDELPTWRQLWLRGRVTNARELETLQRELDTVVANVARKRGSVRADTRRF